MTFTVEQAMAEFFNNSGGGGVWYGGTGQSGAGTGVQGNITGIPTGGTGAGPSSPSGGGTVGTGGNPAGQENYDGIYIDMEVIGNIGSIDLVTRPPQLWLHDQAGDYFVDRDGHKVYRGEAMVLDLDERDWLHDQNGDYYLDQNGLKVYRGAEMVLDPNARDWLHDQNGDYYLNENGLKVYRGVEIILDLHDPRPADPPAGDQFYRTLSAVFGGPSAISSISGLEHVTSLKITPNHGPSLDLTIGTSGNDVIAGKGLLVGGGGADRVKGGWGNDALMGGDGNDVLDGGRGADLLSGGSGTDTVDYSGSQPGIGGEGVWINLATGIGLNGDAQGDRLFDIENVVGSAGNDLIKVGTDAWQDFDGADYLAKNPDLAAYAAANHLDPQLWGYHHWIHVGRFESRAGGWHGTSHAAGADSGTAFDAAGYLAANPDLKAYMDANHLDSGFAYHHWLVCGRDEGRGGGVTASGAVIDAGAGDDMVMGGVYSDYLRGGSGADTLYGGLGQDVLLGGAGRDSLDGGAGNDQVFGGLGDDTLAGGTEDDLVSGGAGSDRLQGGAGHDTLQGGADNDTLFGDDGNDVLDGEAGHDSLDGGAGADVLSGGAGNDVLVGGDGNDTLQGGAGLDSLVGGAGRDTFVFNVATDGDPQAYPYLPVVVDRIKDLEVGDTLKIDGASLVSFVRQPMIVWSGGLPAIGYTTTVLVDNKYQIVLENYGRNLYWDAASHDLIAY